MRLASFFKCPHPLPLFPSSISDFSHCLGGLGPFWVVECKPVWSLLLGPSTRWEVKEGAFQPGERALRQRLRRDRQFARDLGPARASAGGLPQLGFSESVQFSRGSNLHVAPVFVFSFNVAF